MNDLFKNRYRTKTTRLQGWDYGNPGYYFVTITTKNRERFFGEIKNDDVLLSEMGEMTKNLWMKIPEQFDGVELDEYIIMPDHVHGIIHIMSYNRRDTEPPHNDVVHTRRDVACFRRDVACFRRDANNRVSTGDHIPIGNSGDKNSGGITGKHNPMLHDVSIPKIIRYFKGRVTFEINKKFRKNHFAWQSRYYDRIIRDDVELENVRRYVRDNVVRGCDGV
jgi:REP element-mobilizing transposase RayT